MSDYADLMDVFADWYDRGLFKSKGTPHPSRMNRFDMDVMEFLGYQPYWSGMPHDFGPIRRFNEDVAKGLLDVSWVLSPHAETIFKVKLIQKRGR